MIITEGQARSHEDELNNLSAGAVEFTVELSSMLRQMGTMHTALLVKVDRRQQPLAQDARQILDGFGVDVMQAEIPLLAAFEKAAVEGRPIGMRLFRSLNACMAITHGVGCRSNRQANRLPRSSFQLVVW